MNLPNKPRMLTEHVSDWHAGLSVDRTNRTVRNIALTGVVSKNGYRYTERALREAADLYQDKPVFLDHALDKSRPHQRSTRDLVGTIVRPRYESGRIRSDIRVLDTDSGKTFLALAESDAPGVGMSHVVLAQRAATDGAVDRIHDVVSVDAVVFPATTKTFRESVEDASTSTEGECDSCDQLDAPTNHDRDESPTDRSADPVADVVTTAQPHESHVPDRLQQLICERNELLGQLREVRDREHAAAQEEIVDQQLRSSALPEFALTRPFREQLLLADERTRHALIADRLDLIAAAGRHSPSSRERSVSRPSIDSDRAFVAAVKRSAS